MSVEVANGADRHTGWGRHSKAKTADEGQKKERKWSSIFWSSRRGRGWAESYLAWGARWGMIFLSSVNLEGFKIHVGFKRSTRWKFVGWKTLCNISSRTNCTDIHVQQEMKRASAGGENKHDTLIYLLLRPSIAIQKWHCSILTAMTVRISLQWDIFPQHLTRPGSCIDFPPCFLILGLGHTGETHLHMQQYIRAKQLPITTKFSLPPFSKEEVRVCMENERSFALPETTPGVVLRRKTTTNEPGIDCCFTARRSFTWATIFYAHRKFDRANWSIYYWYALLLFH